MVYSGAYWTFIACSLWTVFFTKRDYTVSPYLCHSRTNRIISRSRSRWNHYMRSHESQITAWKSHALRLKKWPQPRFFSLIKWFTRRAELCSDHVTKFFFKNSLNDNLWNKVTPLSSWLGEYSRKFLMGVCRPVLQILFLFQTKKWHFSLLFSDLASKTN